MNTVENGSVTTKPHSKANGSVAPAPQGKPRFGLWLLGIVVVGTIAYAVGVVPRLKARERLDLETIELSKVTVNVVSATQGKASPLLNLPAEIKAYSDAPIFARANGYVKKFYVDIGSHVEAGALLAELDAPELDREIDSARAALARDDAALDLAKTTFTRWQELLKTSSVSDQETAEKKADFALKTATVEASRANLNRLEELKKFTRITAPFAGTITARDIDVGDLISAGSTQQIFHLADTSKLRVFVHLPQTIATSVQTGAAADLIIPDSQSRKYAAKVVRTAGTISAATRTLLTELEVDNSRNEILAGSYAQISFTDLKQEAPTVLPSNTLIFRSDGTLIATVNSENKVEMHPVSIGRDFGRTIEITSGVSGTDQVILNPADSLTAGQVVQIAAATPEDTKK